MKIGIAQPPTAIRATMKTNPANMLLKIRRFMVIVPMPFSSLINTLDLIISAAIGIHLSSYCLVVEMSIHHHQGLKDNKRTECAATDENQQHQSNDDITSRFRIFLFPVGDDGQRRSQVHKSQTEEGDDDHETSDAHKDRFSIGKKAFDSCPNILLRQ